MGAFENLGRSFARRASENVDQRRPRRAKVAVILVFMRVALLVVAWAGFLLYLLYQVIEWTFS